MRQSSAAHQIFDRALLRVRHRRALAHKPTTFLLDRAADDLLDRLDAVTRGFDLAADIGTPGAAVTAALERHTRIGRVVALRPMVTARISGQCALAVVGDEEALPFRDGSLDLAVSALALHTVNDLPGTLAQIRRALRPDGLLLAALLGGETLTELRQSFTLAEAEVTGGVSPRVAPFADVRQMGGLLQRAGFALPVADVDRVIVRYDTAFALMHDLRRMGATNVLVERKRTPLPRKALARMSEIYAQRFADADGRLRATFDIVWLSGWTPHASQQQPLRPGSAQRRLADALGAQEQSTGEKAGS
jgi:SAM-dependent methyltransferase